MSKHSELADRLEDTHTASIEEMELFDSAAAALRELEAENQRLSALVTSQGIRLMDADDDAARIAELEVERERLRADMRYLRSYTLPEREVDAEWLKNKVREVALAALEGEGDE